MAYCTLSDVRAYLKFNASETGDDSVITGLIPHAKAIIDGYCKTTFEASTDSVRYFDAPSQAIESALFPSSSYWMGEQYRVLNFDTWCCQITSVVNGNGVTIPSTQYVKNPRNGTPFYSIMLKRSSTYAFDYDETPENAIAVTARFAYSITAPDSIHESAVELTAHLYSQRLTIGNESGVGDDGAVLTPRGIPATVLAYLAPYRSVTSWR